MHDPVSHPAHYNKGKIEVIEFIEDQGLGFNDGCAVKYICRAGKKDPTKEVEDLEKAMWYLQRQIELLVAKRDGRAVCRPNAMPKLPRYSPVPLSPPSLVDTHLLGVAKVTVTK